MRMCLLIISLLLTTQLVSGQQLQAPIEGKALIYFARTASVGALINFRYFDGDRYIGKFSGRNYVTYECEPGDHLFWANAENRDFVPATVEANKVYIIHAAAEMGMVKARISLYPVSNKDSKLMKRINKLLLKEPWNFNDENLEQKNIELAEYIKASIEKYQSNLEKGWTYPKLTAEMSH